MQEAYIKSTPKLLQPGEWHLPFIRDEDYADVKDMSPVDGQNYLVKISLGRCARVSYLNHDGKRALDEDIKLHDKMVVQTPLHAAPGEHVAQALGWASWCPPSRAGKRADIKAIREAVVEFRDSGEEPTQSDFENSLALHHMSSGNFLGFKQYRKSFANENIGARML